MDEDQAGRLGVLLAWAGFGFGLVALVLQFSLTVPQAMVNGRSLAGAIEYYFSFFTILSNAALVLVHLASASGAPSLARLRRPVVRAGMTGVMLFVCAFYHFVLASTWAPQGWFAVADVALHYAAPLFYAGWWLRFAPHGGVTMRRIPVIAAWPFAYALYALARGEVVRAYPYPVLDAAVLGYGRVAANIAGLLIVFAALCAGVILIDRLLARDRPA
ncbi:Pr6Pr family membrane protein [Sphingomonas sp. KC8]|uniref:Pr6Pr family membrane protein n=1 Tax=Sphingomonas sp. KC8 TaxID=1030157 RepID=UPI000248A7AC|nr:Pr6Pr family membrane protein [Sphingomonas sp. KC8]ARS27389.1 hypothetical protein KC8_08790 [Sphingomonas sp. KC8]